MKLAAHLPRTRITLEPSEDVTGMISIGEKITEELDYTPGKFFVGQFAPPNMSARTPKREKVQSSSLNFPHD